jgi:hypothetical protein
MGNRAARKWATNLPVVQACAHEGEEGARQDLAISRRCKQPCAAGATEASTA